MQHKQRPDRLDRTVYTRILTWSALLAYARPHSHHPRSAPMPYSLLAGDIAEVTIRSSVLEQTVLNVFHYVLTAVAGGGDTGPDGLVDLIEAFDSPSTGASVKLADCMSEDATIVEIVAQKIRPTRWARVTRPALVNAGTISDPPAPSNLAVDLLRRTDLAGRRGNGTIHIGGIPVNMTGGNAVPALLKGSVTAFGAAVSVPLETDAGTIWTPIIFHRDDLGDVTPVTSWAAQDNYRTMRRRGAGQGI